MIAPLGTLVNPVTEEVNFVFFQGRVVERHSFFRVVKCQSADHFAGIGITGNDGEFARFSRSHGFVPEQQTKTRRFFDSSMTGNALLVQNRFDLGIIIYLLVENAQNRK